MALQTNLFFWLNILNQYNFIESFNVDKFQNHYCNNFSFLRQFQERNLTGD